jgi:hypothetical protein
MVLASDVVAPEIRCGFNPERRPKDAQDAYIRLRWSITQLSDVDQRDNEPAVDKWLANKWWLCAVPAATLPPPIILRKVTAGPVRMIISP